MAPPSPLSSLAALDRRVLPGLALRLRSVITRVETAVGGLRGGVRRQREVLRSARTERPTRSIRPVLQAGSQRVLGGLALVLLIAAVALLVVGG